MASLAQESRGLMAADGGPHEDGQLVTLRRPLPLAERRGRQLRALGAALGLLAVAAIGGAAWHPASSGAPRTAVAVRGERGTTIRGVEELELVRAPGKPQLLGALNIPLPHVVLNATADVQELCDSVKDRVPTLLGISGWQIGLAPYKAVSYCTDGLGYTVKVEAEAGKHLEGHPEPAYLQLSIRNDTGPTLFTAIMVESIEGLCASLPVLPPMASPKELPPEASAEEGTNSSAVNTGHAAPPTTGEEATSTRSTNSSSTSSSGQAGDEDGLPKQVTDLSSANSSAGRGDRAARRVRKKEASAKHGTSSQLTNSSAEKGDGTPQLVMAEEVSAAPGMRSSDKEGDAAAPSKKAREDKSADEGVASSAKKRDGVASR
mmetsp:Transcript_51386/g.161508  ORF Transcript_51386/g.161508 Transcript_51386/m.161508 type:complete len:376 (-) Transcript_51386:178-1305(-)